MCGIWASINQTTSRDAIDSVVHRGPDGSGWEEFDTPGGRLVLAHRRLAILDTSERGLQPMAYEDGAFWMTYNGEIYNYIELRRELSALGHEFRTSTDSEVLLAAYAAWGQACLHRLNGMFAFVIWDSRRQALFAARDRYGVKPLYFRPQLNGFAFASEIKQFMSLEKFRAVLNEPRATDFLAAGLSDHTEETFFQGILQLRGGECLWLELDQAPASLRFRVERWYTLPESGSIRLSADEATDRLRDLLLDSIRLRLRADVPVGTCLSGGLDSSTIVCMLSEAMDLTQSGFRPHTFSAVWEDKSLDERRYIDEIIEQTNIRNDRVTPNPCELPDSIDKIIWHHDEPFGSTSIYAQWCVFGLAKKAAIKVVLDGQGADEEFGGYYHMVGKHLAWLIRSLQWSQFLHEFFHLHRGTNASGFQLGAPIIQDLFPSSLTSMLRSITGRPNWPPWLQPAHHTNRQREKIWASAPFNRLGVSEAGDLGALCRAHVQMTNLPMLLRYEDRNSMAHNIEARLPFLDYRIVELAIGLGNEHKVTNGMTKHVLRRAASGRVPQSILDRRDKLGFPTPEAEWLRGPLKDIVDLGIRRSLNRFGHLFHCQRLKRHMEDIRSGRRRFDFALWRVVCLGHWGDVFDVVPERH